MLIPRYYIPNYFFDPITFEIHAFSDASHLAMGAVVYLKITDLNGNTNVPRLELGAAVLATKAVQWIILELKLIVSHVYYYTDSKVTLGYIPNKIRRFFVYVANYVQIIRSLSNPTQWKYVCSDSCRHHNERSDSTTYSVSDVVKRPTFSHGSECFGGRIPFVSPGRR